MAETSPERERAVGWFSSWFSERHYGFVSAVGARPNSKRLFVHASRVTRGVPAAGRTCTFVAMADDRGPYAVDVEIVED